MLGTTTLIIQTKVEDIIMTTELSPSLLNTNNAMAALIAGSIMLIIGIKLVNIKYAAILINTEITSV